MTWRVIEGDSMLEIPKLGERFDAIVTSPPYVDQRHYKTTLRGSYHDLAARSNGALKNQSRKQRREAVDKAVDWLCEFLPVFADALAERGSLVMNLGVVMRGGVDTDWAGRVLRRALDEHGWLLIHRMIWSKANANTLSDPRFLRIGHEDIFWLARQPDVYRGWVDTEERYDAATRKPHAESSLRRIHGPYKDAASDGHDERYSKRSRRHELHPDGARPQTVINVAVGGQRGIRHPAPMAIEVARELVGLTCPPGGSVLDPFCGSGTTGLACLDRDRSFVGVEIEADHAAEARERLYDHAPLLAPAGAAEPDAQMELA